MRKYKPRKKTIKKRKPRKKKPKATRKKSILKTRKRRKKKEINHLGSRSKKRLGGSPDWFKNLVYTGVTLAEDYNDRYNNALETKKPSNFRCSLPQHQQQLWCPQNHCAWVDKYKICIPKRMNTNKHWGNEDISDLAKSYRSRVESLKKEEDPSNDTMVKLVSSEGGKFEVAASAIAISELVTAMMATYGDESEDENVLEIHLPNVDSKTLEKIVEFANYHEANGAVVTIETPIKSAHMKDVVSEWDAEFMENFSTWDNLYVLALAADYMRIQPLLDLVMTKAASMLVGKTPGEIVAELGIVNDMIEEERNRVRHENEWMVEQDTDENDEYVPTLEENKHLSDISRHIVVPYFVDAHRTIKPPHRLIVLWKGIFKHLGPSVYDTQDLRNRCRLFRDSLKPLELWTSYPHREHTSLKSLIANLNYLWQRGENEVPRYLLINNGVYYEDVDEDFWDTGNYLVNNGGCIGIELPLNIIGESRESCILRWCGLEVKAKHAYDVNISNLTIRGSKGVGVFGWSEASMRLDNVSIENSGSYGVFVHGTKRNSMKNCNVSHSKNSGVYVGGPGLITIEGNGTSIHHNGTDGYSGGLTVGKYASVHLVSPLTKRMISWSNGGRNIWNDGTIKTIKLD